MSYAIRSKLNNISFKTSLNQEKVHWEISEGFDILFKEYRKSYVVKNDVTLLNASYFSFLCSKFINLNYSLGSFVASISKPSLFSSQYSDTNGLRWNLYCQLLDNNLDKPSEFAIQHTQDLNSFIVELKQKNHLILKEFKEFVLGFFEYIKVKKSDEYSKFKSIYHLLINEVMFLSRSNIPNLQTYNVFIGQSLKQFSEPRGKLKSFIPSGLCSYKEKYIFINTKRKIRTPHKNKEQKKAIRTTFHHEIGHAIDRTLGNKKILKNQKNNGLLSLSNNPEFLKSVKLNYKKYKTLKSKNHPKSYAYYSYFCVPEIKKVHLQSYEMIKSITNEVVEIFTDFRHVTNNSNEQFTPKCLINQKIYNYSRTLEESWAESFSIIFPWMIKPFSEDDKYTISARGSHNRGLIKSLYHSLIYILHNFKWETLNIPKPVILRKKVQIQKFLDYVYDMPETINIRQKRQVGKKKYLTFKDLMKK